MTSPADVDDERVLRPYAVARGRTELPGGWASVQYVQATIGSGGWDDEYAEVLALCKEPAAAVEVCSRSSQPAVVAALLLTDLIQAGAVRTGDMLTLTANQADVLTLEKVLVGLRKL